MINAFTALKQKQNLCETEIIKQSSNFIECQPNENHIRFCNIWHFFQYIFTTFHFFKTKEMIK